MPSQWQATFGAMVLNVNGKWYYHTTTLEEHSCWLKDRSTVQMNSILRKWWDKKVCRLFQPWHNKNQVRSISMCPAAGF